MPTALITGCAKRVGHNLALHLAMQGWDIGIHYLHSDIEAKELKNKIQKMGCKAYIIKADLSNLSKIKNLFSKSLDPVTLLVNNAAFFENDTVSELNYETLHKHITINLEAPIILSQQFTEQLPNNINGNIVNILDYSIFRTPHNFLSYSVSKSGLHYFTKIAAKQLAPRIRVNAIALGQTICNPKQNIHKFLKICEATPLQRSGTIEETCQTLDFILKVESMTGQVITLDGGMHISDMKYQ